MLKNIRMRKYVQNWFGVVSLRSIMKLCLTFNKLKAVFYESILLYGQIFFKYLDLKALLYRQNFKHLAGDGVIKL